MEFSLTVITGQGAEAMMCIVNGPIKWNALTVEDIFPIIIYCALRICACSKMTSAGEPCSTI